MSSNETVSAALVGLFCVWFGATSSIASAQTSSPNQTEAESTGNLQEVIVTAQKRSENVQDVPISIVAPVEGPSGQCGRDEPRAVEHPGISVQSVGSSQSLGCLVAYGNPPPIVWDHPELASLEASVNNA